MTEYSVAERLLATYTLEEIFEWNALTEEDVLTFLLDKEFVEPPNPYPL